MNEEVLYERWEVLQAFLRDIDPELTTKSVESAKILPGVIEVSFSQSINVAQDGPQKELVTRSYRFAQWPVGE